MLIVVGVHVSILVYTILPVALFNSSVFIDYFTPTVSQIVFILPLEVDSITEDTSTEAVSASISELTLVNANRAFSIASSDSMLLTVFVHLANIFIPAIVFLFNLKMWIELKCAFLDHLF